MFTVFLVEDHEPVRRSLSEVLDADPALRVIGEGGSVADARVRIPRARPDVSLLDVRLPDGDGIDLCRELRHSHDLRSLIHSALNDEATMLKAVQAGAYGYLVKQPDPVQLVAAVKAVGAGNCLLDEHAAGVLMAKLRRDSARATVLGGLTPAERTLLQLLGDGLTNREIGEQMGLAEKTVRNYVSRLLPKLGAGERSAAVRFAADDQPGPGPQPDYQI